MKVPFLHTICLTTLTVGLCGCQSLVPIHVWKSPLVESTVGKKVVVSSLVGPKEVTTPLLESLIANAPKDTGRATKLASSQSLTQNHAIQLVSATEQDVSDIALSSAARNEGYDFVLRGEVVEDRRPPQYRDSDNRHSDKKLSISWRLFGLADNAVSGGLPVVVDRKFAIDRYPDLAFLQSEDQLLMNAAVRETYRMLSPSVDREEVRLAVPFSLPGSRDVRRGNAAAKQGNWMQAEKIWAAVAEKHVWQPAAIHNQAVAAVAKQDFAAARKHIARAVRLHPSALFKSTRAWIEIKQREYHRAFQLPDPVEGWGVTRTDTENR